MGFKTAVCPASNPPKRRSRHPRQQLLQLHAPAICFSGGSRLPLARPQTLQTLHRPFQGKTAVCPASNPPNAAAGLSKATTLSATFPSHLHAPAICFSRGSRLPFARLQTLETPQQALPRQHLFQLHAPAICFSRGSRLLFAQLQTLRTLLQASKATTLTATCPFLSVFQGFKTAVCPASNAPNPSAGLQGTNSYSYMPLPSVFQGVQDCRLPGFKRSKPFRRPPRHQLLQLHAFAICFSGGSRLPFARLQTRQTLLQASKATTLTATCPFLSVFQGFKTAVCPASNAPNPSAGLQGNNSYSYMPPPSVFQGVQDCRLPGFKRSKPFRRPPRHQLLQLHAFAICFSGGSRLPFARLCRLPGFKRSAFPRQQLLQLHAPAICFSGFQDCRLPGFKPPNPSAGLQGNNSYSYYMPRPSVFHGVQDCPLPGFKPSKRFRRLFQGNNSYCYMPLPPIFHGVQACRLPGIKPSKPFRRPPRQQLLQLHAPATCFSGSSRLPLARLQTRQTLPQASKATTLTASCPCHLRLQTLQTLPQASKATTLTATCPCHLFFRGFKTAVCLASNAPNPSAGLQGTNSYSYMPLPSVFQGVQDCRLPGFKRSKPCRRPPRQQLLQLHAPAICFSGGSRLPLARLQTRQTLPQASKATTLTATCPCHLFFRGFKTAVCPASNAPNPSAGLQGNNSYSYMPLPSVFRGFKTAVCPASNAPNPSAGLQGNNSYSSMPLPSVFQGVQDCRLPGFKRSKPFRRPPRQQLLQLHAPANCFSPSNSSAGLQGNNSYSYVPLPSVFHGVQDCRLPGFKPSKRFRTLFQGNNSYSYMPLPSAFHPQTLPRPPRQQLLQLHAPAICFSRVQDCRLPGFAVCPASNPQAFPRQQLLQLLHAFAICFSGGSRLPICQPSNP